MQMSPLTYGEIKQYYAKLLRKPRNSEQVYYCAMIELLLKMYSTPWMTSIESLRNIDRISTRPFELQDLSLLMNKELMMNKELQQEIT